jgi:two-component system, NarL family, response regulator DevR
MHRTALLVDRHPLWLDTIEPVVERAGVEVVGKATTSSTALKLAGRLQPTLLVTGIAMADGELDGIALVRAARARVPALRAIVLSASTDPAHVQAAFEAGARAYVVKTAHADDITSAVRQAFDHSIYLAGAPAAPPPPVVSLTKQPELTRREMEILQLVAEGHSNAELARMLWVTEQTVKFHLSNVYRKLEVSNRTEASRWAQRAGLLAPPAAA